MSAISGLASEEEGVAVLQPNIRKGQGSLAQADGPKPVRINPGDNGRVPQATCACILVYESCIFSWLAPYTIGSRG